MRASPSAGLKFNRPVEVKRRFDVSSERLWGMISAPESLNDNHPFCRTNEVLSWDDDERADRLEYLSGLTYVRRFQSWTPMEGYTLLIGEEGETAAHWEAMWTNASHGSGLLELQVSVDTNEAPGSFLPGSSDDSEEVTVQWTVELFEVEVEAAPMM